MIYLVLSDIHGNLPALEIVLEKEKGNYEAVINLGDVVNYGPWSNECVQLMDSLPSVQHIRGNHEDYFLSGVYSNPGKISELFFKINFPGFTEQKLIGNYGPPLVISDIVFRHTIGDKYIFADTLIDTAGKLCVGHSHRQFKNMLNKFMIINPGSVGQNREFINMISYALYDSVKNEFTFRNIQYDPGIVINEMKSRNFPPACINYYQEKNST